MIYYFVINATYILHEIPFKMTLKFNGHYDTFPSAVVISFFKRLEVSLFDLVGNLSRIFYTAILRNKILVDIRLSYLFSMFRVDFY